MAITTMGQLERAGVARLERVERVGRRIWDERAARAERFPAAWQRLFGAPWDSARTVAAVEDLWMVMDNGAVVLDGSSGIEIYDGQPVPVGEVAWRGTVATVTEAYLTLFGYHPLSVRHDGGEFVDGAWRAVLPGGRVIERHGGTGAAAIYHAPGPRAALPEAIIDAMARTHDAVMERLGDTTPNNVLARDAGVELPTTRAALLDRAALIIALAIRTR